MGREDEGKAEKPKRKGVRCPSPARALVWAALAASLGAGCRRDETGRDPADANGRGSTGPSDPARSTQARSAETRSARPAPGGAAVTPRAVPPDAARAVSDAFAGAAQAISPSVVRLDVEGEGGRRLARGDGPRSGRPAPDLFRRFFDFPGPAPVPSPVRGTGSGIILDSAGHVITNSHVVRGADRVTIVLPDRREFAGRVVGTDPLTDIGVVKFEKPPPGLVVARLGDSDTLRIGEWSIAVGNPLGMAQTVTAGIISGVGETGEGFRFASGQRIGRYIQTDAKINPGNSGGPLVNLEGEVIGINTLINVGPGGSYGFAIPINQAAEVAKALVADGRVRYPYVGVTVIDADDAPEELRAAFRGLPKEGAIVATVAAGGPAARAGIQPGDVITKIGGNEVKTGTELVESLSAKRIGDTVSITFVRNGETLTRAVEIGEYPTEPSGPGGTEQRLGVAIQTLTPPLARSLGIDPAMKGAIITEVAPDSPAARAGLAPGDVIRQVDKSPVTTAEQAVEALQGGEGARLLRITNARGTRFVTIPPAAGGGQP